MVKRNPMTDFNDEAEEYASTDTRDILAAIPVTRLAIASSRQYKARNLARLSFFIRMTILRMIVTIGSAIFRNPDTI